MKSIIAIDGPVGSGKSTIAKKIAKILGYTYLDTGAMYRCIALYVKNSSLKFSGLEVKDVERLEDEIVKLASECDIEFSGERVFLNKEDVTDKIRTQEISLLASSISALIGVREILWKKQREIGKNGRVVAEGRDTGTVIFPDADVKIFLTAQEDERAKRRYRELLEKGVKVDFEKVKTEIALRDKQDLSRKVAPLKKAQDAIEIDTTGISIDEVVERIIKIVKY